MALNLASIQGWQIDRRRALALLEHQRRVAARRPDSQKVWALDFAINDVLEALRDRAACEIAEGVEMRWVHHTWPYKVAA